MKKTIFSALAILLLITTACKKNNDEATPAAGGNATVTAGNYGFDGNTSLGKFSSTKAGIVQASAVSLTTFTVSAIKDGSNESITIILLKKAAIGKYALGPSNSNGSIIISKDYTKAADGSVNYSTDNSGAMQGGGEVNITKLDGSNVEGTFYAVAYNNARKESFVEQGTFEGTIN